MRGATGSRSSYCSISAQAFDTVDHKTLLEVLDRRFGVKGTVLNWFDSYLALGRSEHKLPSRKGSNPSPIESTVRCHKVRFSVPRSLLPIPKTFMTLSCSRRHLSHHLYADDTQLIDGVRIVEISVAIQRLQQCVEEIHRWYASRRLQLNPSKTKAIWFGTAASLRKIKSMDLALHVGSDVIKPDNVARDLGVTLDQELSMKQHINKVTSNCLCQVRRLKQVRRILGPQITTRLITAFVTSRLDYCNSVLAGLSKLTIMPFQRVQNAAARLITGIGRRDHATLALRKLHWLPIPYRIKYKLCVLMHQVHTACSPSYMSNLVTTTANLSPRHALRSASSQRYEVPRTKLKFRGRAFSFAGPSVWNSLPSNLQKQSDIKTFKKLLKTFLFAAAYENWLLCDAPLVTIGVSGAL